MGEENTVYMRFPVTVNVRVYISDVQRIIEIGSKPWGQVTIEERKEYDRLISLYGSMVCHAVLRRNPKCLRRLKEGVK